MSRGEYAVYENSNAVFPFTPSANGRLTCKHTFDVSSPVPHTTLRTEAVTCTCPTFLLTFDARKLHTKVSGREARVQLFLEHVVLFLEGRVCLYLGANFPLWRMRIAIRDKGIRRGLRRVERSRVVRTGRNTRTSFSRG